ncbi:MAG: hypothetical protein U9R37_04425 [Campylobacterota bacterium]|nr:hypothetical protein [Campylobacterota bacterium]
MLDLEYLKSTKNSLVLLGCFVLIGCTNSTSNLTKDDNYEKEPAWVSSVLPDKTTSACSIKKNKSMKKLKKLTLAKAKRDFIFQEKTSIESSSKKVNGKFVKNSQQNSYNSYDIKDFHIKDKYENKTKYCLLVEYIK